MSFEDTVVVPTRDQRMVVIDSYDDTLVRVRPSADAATKVVSVGVPGPPGTPGAANAAIVLDYTEDTDTVTALSLPADVWIDVHLDQDFSLAQANSIVEIGVIGRMRCNIPPSTDVNIASAVLIDGVTRRIISGALALGGIPSSIDPLGGTSVVKFDDLDEGAHTVRVQVMANSTINGAANLRSASMAPYEFLSIQIEERSQ